MKKVVIVSLICILLLLIAIYATSLIKKDETYLVIDNSVILSFDKENNYYSKIDFETLRDKELFGFSNGEYIGSYKVERMDENGEIFVKNEDDDNAYLFEHPYIFSTSDIEVLEYNEEDCNNDDFNILKMYYDLDFINDMEDIGYFKKVKYDLDGNGDVEVIYYASYYDMDDVKNSFSGIFIKDNDKYYNMYLDNSFSDYEEDNETINSLDTYSLAYLLKINDKVHMVVTSKEIDVANYSIFGLNSEESNLIEYYK